MEPFAPGGYNEVGPSDVQGYREAREQLGQIQEELAGFERMGRLLWQTAKPLEEAVHDVFRAAGLTLTSRTRVPPTTL